MNEIGRGPQARHRALILAELPPGAALSRKELSARTGLSPATVLRITRRLLKGQVLREADSQPQAGAGRPSPGLEINGRLAVVFSPYDLSCALENHESLECKGYIKADAARLGVNVILFALQQ